MTPVFRSCLAFIHKWFGYPTGLFLFILFFTGSLATLSVELQQWMEPQTAIKAPLSEEGITGAETVFRKSLQNAPNSFLRLPTKRDPVIRILHFNGHVFLGSAVNPKTGSVIPTPKHSGATFFVLLHSSFLLPVIYGASVETIIFIGLLVAFITGIWIHLKRFFPDLLLIRPQASQNRRLLDLHLLAGCTILPVFIVISFSGALLNLHRLGLIGPHHSHSHSHTKTKAVTQLPPLAPMIKEGMEKWHDLEGAFFLNTPQGLHFIRGDETAFCSTRSFISSNKQDTARQWHCNSLALFHAVHRLRWAHGCVRFCLCLIGILGALLTGTGMLLFTRKECTQNIKKPGHSLIIRIYKALNDGTMMGLPFATFCLLALTRLPTHSIMSLYQREICIFFILWSGCYAISFLAGPKYRVTAYLLAIAGFSILPLDLMTRPPMTETASSLIIDVSAFLIGVTALFTIVKRRRGV